MVVTFLGCTVITHWLPHTLVQICFKAFKNLVLTFLFEYTSWSFCFDFSYNFIALSNSSNFFVASRILSKLHFSFYFDFLKI